MRKAEANETVKVWPGLLCKASFVWNVCLSGYDKRATATKGLFFSLMNFKPSLKHVHYISNGVPRPAFSSVVLSTRLKGEEGVFLSVGGEIQG